MIPTRPSKPTVAIFGGRGMLGRDLARTLEQRGWHVRSLDLPEFNICIPDQLAMAIQDSTCVINCAAYTHVDRAEQEPEKAREINAHAVACLAEIASHSDRYVIHLSTDFVFDGTLDRPYSEEDSPRPLNVYAQTKREGELAMQASQCRHAIVRLQWTYGLHGVNFARKILERAGSVDRLQVVDDQVGSPTWTIDVANALAVLAVDQITGLYHYAANGYASRCDIARFILEESGIKREIIPCKTIDFPTPAKRPLNSRFNCSKIDSILPAPRPQWQDSLRTFLRLFLETKPLQQ